MTVPSILPGQAPDGHAQLIEVYGFVPGLFLAQSELPRVMEAKARFVASVMGSPTRLTSAQKKSIIAGVAHILQNNYCQALHGQKIQDAWLFFYAAKLARHGSSFSKDDIDALRTSGLDDVAIVEFTVTAALGHMLCTLAVGLHPSLDPEISPPAAPELLIFPRSIQWAENPSSFLGPQPERGANFPPYLVLRESFGFVPALYRAQSAIPEVLTAEVQLLDSILLPEDWLSRIQKENILLAISAANLNTYCVAIHGQILDALGVPLEESDQIVEDHHQAKLSPSDIALLDEVRKLSVSAGLREGCFNPEALRAYGFSEAHIVEAVSMAALANFLNTLQFGLGTSPDFPPHRIFTEKDLYRFSDGARPTSQVDDPDAALVAQVQNGSTDAFEELVRRHTRRIFGTLAGLIGNMDDARDATQDVFLKAFEHIGRFQGRSKFSTWLTSIAINTGTELLRRHKPSEPLTDEEDEGFRPLHLQAWTENPEQLFAVSQRNTLVREAVLRLPQKYRIAVLLRDINQVSTEEAAAALELSVPALKARVLRGRLMLRESLAPYFVHTDTEKSDA
jgi:RNA polymerase sigma-70 factor, ECF subfamily